jgi:beta-lactamase superfamily II metal-dependent hydrolase
VSGKAGTPDGVSACLRFFYCGRGDTIIVEARGGGWGLIDCNLTRCSKAHQRVRELVRQKIIRQLQFVCLTHPDQDHYHGMRELLEECFCDFDRGRRLPRFKQFWDSGVELLLIEGLARHMSTREAGKELAALMDFLSPLFQNGAVERVALTAGVPCLDGFGDFVFVALSPRRRRVEHFNQTKIRRILQSSEEFLQGPLEEKNNLSVVLVLMHQRLPLNVLFGGDATAEIWEEALATWQKLLKLGLQPFHNRKRHFDGVKVSHHGALSSLHTELYQDYCIPENTVAILSVGHNDNQHPHADVLSVLKKHKIRAYATCWPTRGESPQEETLPLLGEPVGGEAERYPVLPGYGCADVEVKVWSDGRLEASPPASLLPL